MQLRGVRALTVEPGDAEHRARGSIHHREVKDAVVPPRGLITTRERKCAFRRGFASPRHPRQQLWPGVDDRRVDPLDVGDAHRLQKEPIGGQAYSAREGGDAFAPSTLAGPTQTVWMFVNSLIPYSESSRP